MARQIITDPSALQRFGVGDAGPNRMWVLQNDELGLFDNRARQFVFRKKVPLLPEDQAAAPTVAKPLARAPKAKVAAVDPSLSSAAPSTTTTQSQSVKPVTPKGGGGPSGAAPLTHPVQEFLPAHPVKKSLPKLGPKPTVKPELEFVAPPPGFPSGSGQGPAPAVTGSSTGGVVPKALPAPPVTASASFVGPAPPVTASASFVGPDPSVTSSASFVPPEQLPLAQPPSSPEPAVTAAPTALLANMPMEAQGKKPQLQSQPEVKAKNTLNKDAEIESAPKLAKRIDEVEEETSTSYSPPPGGALAFSIAPLKKIIKSTKKDIGKVGAPGDSVLVTEKSLEQTSKAEAPFAIFIDPNINEAWLVDENGREVKRFPVGTGDVTGTRYGKKYWTPTGDLEIINEVPYKKVWGGFAPLWMGISGTDVPRSRGFGLHGPHSREDLKENKSGFKNKGFVSHGCIRFRQADILAVGKALGVGAKVTILPYEAAYARKGKRLGQS